jgi:hypothetical protein
MELVAAKGPSRATWGGGETKCSEDRRGLLRAGLEGSVLICASCRSPERLPQEVFSP